MTEFQAPPSQPSRISAERVLVIAPHFDDEVLGCGGLLLQLVASGSDVRVLFLSDSSGGKSGVDDPGAYSARRHEEAQRVAERMSLASISVAGFPDGALMDHVDDLAAPIAGALADFRPDLVLAPSPLEITADHRAAFRALHRSLSPLRPGDPLHATAEAMRVLLYEINAPLHPDVLVDVGRRLDDLQALMNLYASQMEQRDYVALAVGLRRYRTLTLPNTVRAAEAYRSTQLDDYTTRSWAGLVAHLGGAVEATGKTTGPLVTVIVRTKDRPRKFRSALESICQSTYRDVQVVVINDGGQTPQYPDLFPFPLKVHDLPQNVGPAAAAQAGLEAASGEYVSFLDDDDVFFPEHLATLVRVAEDGGCPAVYSDAAVVVYESNADGEWRLSERRLPYSRDYDAALLLVDNYIPFHTLLVRRDLAIAAGPFDDSLAAFEDWDFLIRLSALTRFEHIRRVTCEYRHFRGDPAQAFGTAPDSKPEVVEGVARIYAKHAERLGPAALAAAVAALRRDGAQRAERCRALSAELRLLRGERECS